MTSILYVMDNGGNINGFSRTYEPNEVISDREYYCDDELQQYTIPNGIRHIGAGAFAGCSNLRRISIPDGVESIDHSAFAGCTALEEIIIPDTVWYVAYDLCHGCTSLKSVRYTHSGAGIPLAAFAGCTSLEKIAIPDEVKYIGVQAFIHTALTSVVIPKGATISCDAFSENAKLQEVVFGDGVIVEHHAFCDCKGLLRLSNLENAEYVDPHAFSVG